MQFQQALRSLDIGPAVGALKDRLRRIAEDEYRRQRPRLGDLTPEQERAVQSLLLSAVNKIAHPVIHRMRRSYDTGEEEDLRAWRDIFKLEE